MREKRGSLVHQVKQIFDSKLRIGESRHEAKLSGEDRDGIYSWGTYQTYLKHAAYFVRWCKTEHDCKTVAECRQYADQWLASRFGLSAWTVKMEVSALSKLYNDTAADYIETPSRHRENITRSRGEAVRDKHFSEEKNRFFVDFCKSTGLRRSEIACLTGDQLLIRDNKPYIYVYKGTKGGRMRYAPIVAEKELETKIIARMQEAGNDKVFDYIPNGADVHSYRGDYATALYRMNERDFDTVKKSGDIYYCRRDRAGTWFDKQAMQITSQALGHNRIDVIAGHYIR